MDMSVSRSNSASFGSPAGSLPKAVDRKAFHDLRTDLKSGDIDGAKQAFSTLTRNVPDSVLSNPNTALGQLGQALQSGDTTAAQQALGAFAQNVHSYRSGQGVPVAGPVSTAPIDPTDTVNSSTGGPAGTLLNAVA